MLVSKALVEVAFEVSTLWCVFFQLLDFHSAHTVLGDGADGITEVRFVPNSADSCKY